MARRRFQQGSLILRGKRRRVWVARWWEDVIKPDGKLGRVRRAEVIGTLAELPTKRKAMQVLFDHLGSVNSGRCRPQSSRTLEAFVRENWEPVILPMLKYATQLHYRYLLNGHILPEFGSFQLRQITREAIQGFLFAKLKRGLSWETVHHLRCALSKILGVAEEWEYLEDNPVQKTKLPRREDHKERQLLTLEQVRVLTSNLQEPARSVVLVLVSTGMRIGELLALRWRNVDLEAGLVRVEETVYDGHFDRPKTKRSTRAIPLGPETAKILRDLQPLEIGPGELVFHNRCGKPLNRRNLLNRQVRPVCEALGLSRVSWHAFRHCNATLLDSVGAPWGTVQALLGHATPEMTRRVYVHAVPKDQQIEVEKVEEMIFGPKWTQVLEASGSDGIPIV